MKYRLKITRGDPHDKDRDHPYKPSLKDGKSHSAPE
jgi:hypothetical protein